MMKKIMIAGFWALLLIPNLLFPFVKGSSQTGTGENRNLAEFPVFSPDTYEAYPAAVNSYINDHAAFRNLFLSLNSMINLKLFGYADSQDVIVGKDGWYFFAGGMSLYDALGTQPFYPDDAAWIGGQIIKAAGYYESRGIPFLSVFLQPGLVIVLHLIIEGDAVFRIGPQLIRQRLRPGSPAGGGDQQTGGADDRQQTDPAGSSLARDRLCRHNRRSISA